MVRSLPNWLVHRSYLTPERTAVAVGDSQTYTWSEVNRAAARFAGQLLRAGLRRGDRVAILSGNGFPFVLAVHGLARLGGTAVPINTRLADAEIAEQLRTVDATAILADDTYLTRAQAYHSSSLPLDTLAAKAVLDGCSKTESDGARFSSPLRTILDDPQGILFTSGTTGSAKGAVLTFGNHWWSAVASALNLGLHEGDRWLLCLPLFHIGGLSILMRSVIYGITAVVHERFDPERVNRAIDHEGVTIVSVVSQMLERMLDARRDAPYPESLRCVLTGGGPVPKPLLERCVRIGIPVVQTYGMTETASQAATLAPEDAIAKLGSAGKPLFCTDLKVDAPPGEVGEIRVRGPNVSPGYVNRHGFQRRTGEWLRTGDLGRLDDEGYLYIASRRSDLIISGGENIYPAEIEAVLESHPGILEAGVVGMSDERWGQVPVAYVVANPGHTLDPDDLARHCRGNLAKFKVPVSFTTLDRLPRNASGKLLRHKLRGADGKEAT